MVTFLMTFSTPNLVFNITIFLKANISKTVRLSEKVTIGQ